MVSSIFAWEKREQLLTKIIDGSREDIRAQQLISVEVVRQAPCVILAVLRQKVMRDDGEDKDKKIPTASVRCWPSEDKAKFCHWDT